MVLVGALDDAARLARNDLAKTERLAAGAPDDADLTL
jgi:hypothetical protein